VGKVQDQIQAAIDYKEEHIVSVIYKYELFPTVLNTLKLPRGAQIIHLAAQGGGLMLWAIVDKDEEELVKRHFRVLGTGQSTSLFISPSSHIGTCFYGPEDDSESLVLHVFEVQP